VEDHASKNFSPLSDRDTTYAPGSVIGVAPNYQAPTKASGVRNTKTLAAGSRSTVLGASKSANATRRPAASVPLDSRTSRKSARGSPAHSAAGSLASERLDAAREHIPESGYYPVILVWEKKQKKVKLDLNAEGDTFFEALQGHNRKLRKDSSLHLDREVDKVTFSTHLDVDSGETYEVDLMEKDMGSNWRSAAGWIRKMKSSLASDEDLFAIMEQDRDLDLDIDG
jgi:hypothetical protein